MNIEYDVKIPKSFYAPVAQLLKRCNQSDSDDMQILAQVSARTLKFN